MVGTELRQDLIDGGRVLISKLDETGLQPDAAFWFYFPDARAWKLVLADVTVGKNGPKEVYRRIQRILSKAHDSLTLSLDDIVLLTPDAPLVNLVRTAIQTGPHISGFRFSNNVINGIVVEDAYIYRLSSASHR